MNLFETFKQACQDRQITLEELAEKVRVPFLALKHLEAGNLEEAGKQGLSTAGLTRIGDILNLPISAWERLQAQALNIEGVPNQTLHRCIIYQDLCSPEQLNELMDLLYRWRDIYLIWNKKLDFNNLKKLIEDDLRPKVVQAYKEGMISKGRAQELLGLTVWDDLPE
jgi:transcriptional regulator with XRE-family HTH domain